MHKEDFDPPKGKSGRDEAAHDEGAGGREMAAMPGAQEELEHLRADLDEARRESEARFRLLQQAQADLVNYRRRTEQERADALRGAKADVLLSVLPVLDDFERALQAAPPEHAGQPWVEGLALIERKLRSALEAHGVTPVEALGKPFDPWEHEAVLYEESPAHEEGQVIAVLRPGYKLQGKVIRPAQVKVAKGS